MHGTIAASLVCVLVVLGWLVWPPWPGPGWWVLGASHAWLVLELVAVNKSQANPPTLPVAAVALATTCTVALACTHTAYGLGSYVSTGWGLGLCVWLVSLQALAATL